MRANALRTWASTAADACVPPFCTACPQVHETCDPSAGPSRAHTGHKDISLSTQCLTTCQLARPWDRCTRLCAEPGTQSSFLGRHPSQTRVDKTSTELMFTGWPAAGPLPGCSQGARSTGSNATHVLAFTVAERGQKTAACTHASAMTSEPYNVHAPGTRGRAIRTAARLCRHLAVQRACARCLQHTRPC